VGVEAEVVEVVAEVVDDVVTCVVVGVVGVDADVAGVVAEVVVEGDWQLGTTRARERTRTSANKK
jgi:hypothetical protein